MKKLPYMIRSLILLSFICSPTFAGTSSILGTWAGKSDLIKHDGTHALIDYKLKFTEIRDNYVVGVASWKAAKGNKHSVGKELRAFADENFIGTYDQKNNIYYLVETTENSILKVEPLANGDINVIYLEGGKHAVVFNGVLKKQ